MDTKNNSLNNQIAWLCRQSVTTIPCLGNWQAALGANQYVISKSFSKDIKEPVVFIESAFDEDHSDFFLELQERKKFVMLLECGGLDMIFDQHSRGAGQDGQRMAEINAARMMAIMIWKKGIDLIACFRRSSKHYFQDVLGIDAAYVGMPYNTTYFQNYEMPQNKRDGVLVLADTKHRGNCLSSFAVMKRLVNSGIKVYGIINIYKHAKTFLKHFGLSTHSLFNGSDFLPFDDYHKLLGTCVAGVNLTVKRTFGRMAISGAMVGTPMIGSGDPDAQAVLWPSLTVHDPFNPEETANKIIDKRWNLDTIQFAKDKMVEEYSVTACTKRLKNVLKTRDQI